MNSDNSDDSSGAPSVAMPTPRTDFVAREIGRLAAQWKAGEIDSAQNFAIHADSCFYYLREMEKQHAELKAANATLRGELDSTARSLDENAERLREKEINMTAAILERLAQRARATIAACINA